MMLNVLLKNYYQYKKLETMLGSAIKQCYSNLSDLAKSTLKTIINITNIY